ncbi:MAG TPA: hypothetical protein GXZ25_11875 [Peptococcaceae bacterium]|mgnify:FL=1|nr:hypothetical protein [Peptococcaceae bacterium]
MGSYRACPMNCRYCSLGESWGIVKKEGEFNDQEVIRIAQKYVEEGIRWIVLRTTQFYSPEKIIALVGKIKKTMILNLIRQKNGLKQMVIKYFLKLSKKGGASRALELLIAP